MVLFVLAVVVGLASIGALFYANHMLHQAKELRREAVMILNRSRQMERGGD